MENQEPAPETGRACRNCDGVIPDTMRSDAVFCSGTCRDAENRVRNKHRRTEQHNHWCRENQETRRAQVRKGKARWKLADIRRSMLAGAKGRAVKQGLPFNLTVEDIELPEYCPVFGIPLTVGEGGATDSSPSLDKIIPALGYTRGNVVVISNRANRAKSNLAVHELRLLADFYENLISTGWMRTRKETPP